MEFVRPPVDPITRRRPGEALEEWRRRDEAAKAEREWLGKRNAFNRLIGAPEQPEPDWADWAPLPTALDHLVVPRPHGTADGLDPAVSARMDHYGWQQLENLQRYGALKTEILPCEASGHFSPLGSEWGSQVETLTFEATSSVRPGGSKQGPLIGRPGQGTHSYKKGPNNWQSDHAVDVAMKRGTPVYAIADGMISNGYGYGDTGKGGRFEGARLHLEFGNDVAYYAHLSRIVVPRGAPVREGQLIGYSGVANGVPHLHFAVKASDPLAWVQRGRGA